MKVEFEATEEMYSDFMLLSKGKLTYDAALDSVWENAAYHDDDPESAPDFYNPNQRLYAREEDGKYYIGYEGERHPFKMDGKYDFLLELFGAVFPEELPEPSLYETSDKRLRWYETFDDYLTSERATLDEREEAGTKALSEIVGHYMDWHPELVPITADRTKQMGSYLETQTIMEFVDEIKRTLSCFRLYDYKDVLEDFMCEGTYTNSESRKYLLKHGPAGEKLDEARKRGIILLTDVGVIKPNEDEF